MYQDPLPHNSGILFEFDHKTTTSFWNKNVSFPIDVAFFDEDYYLINVEQLEPNQLMSVTALKPYKYVIETNKGWFKENHINPGDSMKSLLNLNLLNIGFKKASFDPTSEHQQVDTTSTYLKIKNIPTTAAIKQLSKEWLKRKPPTTISKEIYEPKEI